MTSFDILVSVVSFDYFPVADVFDLGFTPTPPFSKNFEYLDYESLNFVEGMGSILILMWIGTLQFLVLLFLVLCNIKIGNKRCRSLCNFGNFFKTTLGFL